MPAKSKQQQKAAGMAMAAKRGAMPMSKLRCAAKEMAKMGMVDLRHIASTPRKSLPKYAGHSKKK